MRRGEVAIDRRLDDGIDFALEGRLACGVGGPDLLLPALFRALFFLQSGLVASVFLEDLKSRRHAAQLIAPADTRHDGGFIAGGELRHRISRAANHAAESTPEGNGEDDAEGDDRSAAGNRDPPGEVDRGGRIAAEVVAVLAFIFDERIELVGNIVAEFCQGLAVGGRRLPLPKGRPDSDPTSSQPHRWSP